MVDCKGIIEGAVFKFKMHFEMGDGGLLLHHVLLQFMHKAAFAFELCIFLVASAFESDYFVEKLFVSGSSFLNG